jgi:hypothetical protein
MRIHPTRFIRFIVSIFVVLTLFSGIVFSATPETVPVKYGENTISNKNATVDVSNVSEGYIIVRYTGNKPSSIKAQVKKTGGKAYTVIIDRLGKTEFLPLSYGSGIKAYSHLFTEISPPVPKEYADCFSVNGKLLPGYTLRDD